VFLAGPPPRAHPARRQRRPWPLVAYGAAHARPRRRPGGRGGSRAARPSLSVLSRAQVVDANQAKSETWLDEEYQLTPKVRDVRDHGACYCAWDVRVRSVPRPGVLTRRCRWLLLARLQTSWSGRPRGALAAARCRGRPERRRGARRHPHVRCIAHTSPKQHPRVTRAPATRATCRAVRPRFLSTSRRPNRPNRSPSARTPRLAHARSLVGCCTRAAGDWRHHERQRGRGGEGGGGA
jgi:hypothetical protein